MPPQTHHLPRSLILTPFLGTLHKAQSNHVLVMHNSNYGQLPLSYSCSFLPSVRKFAPNKLDSSRMRARKRLDRGGLSEVKATGSSIHSFILHLCRVRSTKCMKGARAARQGSGGGGRSGGDAADADSDGAEICATTGRSSTSDREINSLPVAPHSVSNTHQLRFSPAITS